MEDISNVEGSTDIGDEERYRGPSSALQFFFFLHSSDISMKAHKRLTQIRTMY